MADVCAMLSAFFSHIYGPNLVKEVVDLFLVWERQVHIHTGANGAVSPPPPPQALIKVISPRTHGEHLPFISALSL